MAYSGNPVVGSNQFTVTVPEGAGLHSVLYVRFGRIFRTLEAAQRTARRLSGRVHPLGSNEILADFGDDLTPEPIQVGRQSRGAALAAYLGVAA